MLWTISDSNYILNKWGLLLLLINTYWRLSWFFQSTFFTPPCLPHEEQNEKSYNLLTLNLYLKISNRTLTPGLSPHRFLFPNGEKKKSCFFTAFFISLSFLKPKIYSCSLTVHGKSQTPPSPKSIHFSPDLTIKQPSPSSSPQRRE